MSLATAASPQRYFLLAAAYHALIASSFAFRAFPVCAQREELLLFVLPATNAPTPLGFARQAHARLPVRLPRII